ncbi:MAG TPA: response regulator, partial [Planctomycetota bacterium]|nr:response regulator [Planctomycetota bacterium]
LGSDMRMPGMDGLTLLAEVKKQWPTMTRIVLSGYSEHEQAMRSIHEVHQYLTKPCAAEQLVATVERSLRLRAMLQDRALLALVSGTGHLFTLPRLYQQISAAMQDQNSSLKEIGVLIGSDIAISAKILQIVNSAFFALPRQVQSTAEAAVLLGSDMLRALILGTEMFSSFRQDLATTAGLDALWARSLRAAVLARQVALHLGCDEKTAGQAFFAASLQDVGQLLLLAHRPDDFLRCRQAAAGDELRQIEHERATFSASHQEVGACLLGMWGLGDVIVEAVACHHQPHADRPPVKGPAAAVHLATCLTAARAHAPQPAYLTALDLDDAYARWRAGASDKSKPS